MLPAYHAPTDSASSLLSYYSINSQGMLPPEEDDLTSILVDQLRQLYQRLEQLESQRATPLSAFAPVAPVFVPPELHIADPTLFSGKCHELCNFLSKCRLKFAGQPSKFATESSKIYYLGSHLTD